MKIKIKKHLEEIHIFKYSSFPNNIDAIINQLDELKIKYSDYDNIWIESEYDYDNYSYYLKGERLETDKEYENRVQKEQNVKVRSKKFKDAKIEKERKEYERLKKIFEESYVIIGDE